MPGDIIFANLKDHKYLQNHFTYHVCNAHNFNYCSS